MVRKQISQAAEQHLEAWLDQFLKGQLHITELPLCVAAWFHAGEAGGRAVLQSEIDQLNHQLDAYWARAFLTKDERRERILQRLDAGLQQADEATWAQLEQDLAIAAGRNITTNIEGAVIAPVGSRNDGRTSNTPGPSAAGRTAA